MHESPHLPYIPERYTREIVLHVAKNFIAQDSMRSPLTLGIHGPSGDGKTYQCEEVLAQMRVRSFLISGGQLESPDAGEPALLIRRTYLAAGDWLKRDSAGNFVAAVLLINDIDTGLGDWGPLNQTTVNRQTVFGEIMHITDYPTHVENRSTVRVPIIVTGNDFTKLYGPLARSGRMKLFEWCPSPEERAQIVAQIFRDLSEAECNSLVREFPVQPIAFFSDLKASLFDDLLWNELRSKRIGDLVCFVRSNRLEVRQPLRLSDVIRFGKALEQSRQLRSHVTR